MQIARRCGHTENSTLDGERATEAARRLCAACWQGVEEDKAPMMAPGGFVTGCPTWSEHDRVFAINIRRQFATWYCTVARPGGEARATDAEQTAAAKAFRSAMQQVDPGWWIRAGGPADILRNMLKVS